MPVYQAPLDDIRFVLEDLLEVEQLSRLPGWEEATPDLIASVIEEGAKVCEEVLFPLNLTGDVEGCHFDSGTVTTPKGFRAAYRTYAEGGWTGLACDPDYGGQGLPELVNFVMEEIVCSANLAFGIYPGLSRGVYNALKLHGSDALKRRYLPRLVDGTWSGTMCLTEPDAGSDLGQVHTRAEPSGDGRYSVTGTKIFISAGEHDLTANIVHLVLARLPGAPAGTRGISLFIVPKFLPTDDAGGLGDRNTVSCGSIEHKMGIRASCTCVLNFDGATGWLVGEPNKGMRAMFTMMNAARLAVGLQGLGLAEVAGQNALAYARERLQGRALKGGKYPDKPADPLIVHPDIRRMLLTIKAYTEGGRALACWIGLALDRQERHPDPKEREAAGELVALMTPIVKALLTDTGFEAADLAVQIFGGHGYICENGVEQYLRDARITRIYEGTNGIQALDLVGRKLPHNMGHMLRHFFHPVAEELQHAPPALAELATPLTKAFGRLQNATTMVAFRGLADPDEAAAAASDYLRLFGLVALGVMWLRMAKVAVTHLNTNADDPRAALYRSKISTARFYMAKLLPQTGALLSTLQAGAGTLMAEDALEL
ncbi:MAG: acyl-CoA dehydrogenase C-terminal domain-containing protein [Rhodospirillaceae bacterium]